MNVQTNELYDLELEHKDIIIRPDVKKNLKPVPKHLNRAANSVLKGKSKAKVSFNSGGKLSKWAASQRRY